MFVFFSIELESVFFELLEIMPVCLLFVFCVVEEIASLLFVEFSTEMLFGFVAVFLMILVESIKFEFASV